MPRLMGPAATAALSAIPPTPPGPPNSAFPLAYIPHLRSCRSWVLFSGHPCLPCCWKSYEQQGSFAPRALPRFDTTTSPSATLSSSADFPVLPVIRPIQLPPFRVGTRRVSPVARRILVIVPSLTTPPERPAASIGLRQAVLPSPSRLRARPSGLHLRGHLAFTIVTARQLALTRGEVVEGLQTFGFPPACPPATGLPILTPAGLAPAGHISLPGRTTGRAAFSASGSPVSQCRNRLAAVGVGSDSAFRITRFPKSFRPPDSPVSLRPVAGFPDL